MQHLVVKEAEQQVLQPAEGELQDQLVVGRALEVACYPLTTMANLPLPPLHNRLEEKFEVLRHQR